MSDTERDGSSKSSQQLAPSPDTSIPTFSVFQLLVVFVAALHQNTCMRNVINQCCILGTALHGESLKVHCHYITNLCIEISGQSFQICTTHVQGWPFYRERDIYTADSEPKDHLHPLYEDHLVVCIPYTVLVQLILTSVKRPLL